MRDGTGRHFWRMCYRFPCTGTSQRGRRRVEGNADEQEKWKINTTNIEQAVSPPCVYVCVRVCRMSVCISKRKHVILWKLHLWELQILIRAALSHLANTRRPNMRRKMAWRVFKLLFYVREANVKIRYFCLCCHRIPRMYDGPEGNSSHGGALFFDFIIPGIECI